MPGSGVLARRVPANKGGLMPTVPRPEFKRLPLRVHTVLAGVPLHDAWAIDLAHWRPGITLRQFLKVSPLSGMGLSPSARTLLRLRRRIGKTFGWDRRSDLASTPTFVSQVPPDVCDQSVIEPGTPEGDFRVVYSLPNEHLSELTNKLVHAALSVALIEDEKFYRLYLGVFVLSLSRITPYYMAAIAPFRHWIVYPSILNTFRKNWNDCFSANEGEVCPPLTKPRL